MHAALLGRTARRLRSLAQGLTQRHLTVVAERLLLRDYIHRQLYAPGDGYFSRTTAPVACLEEGLDFGALPTRADYLRAVKAAYERLQVAWLTPSEILTPHYGRAVAACVLQRHTDRHGDAPLHIFELGAGTGTLARDVLDTIRHAAPRIYESCSYTSVEISPALAQRQLARVGHGRRFAVQLRDAAEASGWGPPDPAPCTILGFEACLSLLDIGVPRRVSRAPDGGWLQEEAELSGDGAARLLQRPLADPAVREVLELALGLPPEAPAGGWLQRTLDWLLPAGGDADRRLPYGRCRAAFLPTKAAQLLDTLARARPAHQLLLGDFASLPDVTIPGRNAPLVATTARLPLLVGGRTVDHSSYCVPQGSADIFFPTDFRLLQALHRRSCEKAGSRSSSSRVLSNQQFMRTFGDSDATALRDGWRPLADDYSNTAFLLAASEIP